MQRALTTLLAGATATVAFTACGGSSSPLGDTSANLSAIHSGVLNMQLLMNTQRSGDVGFTVSGPFDMAGGDGGAAQLTTVLHCGAAQTQATVTAAHGHAYVSTGGRTYRMSGAESSAVTSAVGQAQGFSGLHLDQWITSPQVSSAGTVDGVAADRITGTLNVPVALQDILTLQARAQGAAAPHFDSATQQQLRNVAQSSSVEVVTGHDDRLLRSLHATVDLVAALPAQARAQLGDLGSVHIDFSVALSRVNQSVTVQEPANPLPAADLPASGGQASP
jgi:hypothetical protein